MSEYQIKPLRDWLGVVGLVVLLHAAGFAAWVTYPKDEPAVVISQMSVEMQQSEVVQPQPAPPKPQQHVEQVVKAVSKSVNPVSDIAQQVAPSQAFQPAPPVEAQVPVAPHVSETPIVETAPDYKAGYLNNSRPHYPMAARKMNWEGTVILNVEVLALGRCGELNVFKSSGREVLDNAAMQTVKNWRFIPARHGDQAITKWFKVPIQFSLEDNEV
ncbi:MAG: energy transducer TonB [Gallionella sp.]|nr:energy transducer TonB [Gallionella sp.]MDD4945986.1 energy transducer TonB [Gallionella sp.]MDD5612559.1 energy transducer TonB [Gallionella sp.]